MTTQMDIYRSANAWVAQHGERAHKMALDMAGLYAGRGEPEGEAVWRRIAAAVEELQKTERPEDTSEH